MPKDFPCPNPVCQHVFPADSLAGVAKLTCPKCGSVFQLRAEPASAGPKAVPVASPLTKASAHPIAATERDHEHASAFRLTPEVGASALTGRHQRKISQWLKAGVLLLSLLGFAAGAIGLWTWLSSVVHEPADPAGNIVKIPQLNLQFIEPSGAWEEEEGPVKASFKAALVLRRTGPRAWMALFAKDYKDHVPTDTELRDEAVRRLGLFFHKENLEWEQENDSSLANLRAQHLVFRGEVNNTSMSGECFCATQQSLVYWLLTWAPSTDMNVQLKEEFNDLRKRFSLLKVRGKGRVPAAVDQEGGTDP